MGKGRWHTAPITTIQSECDKSHREVQTDTKCREITEEQEKTSGWGQRKLVEEAIFVGETALRAADFGVGVPSRG